MHVHALHVHRHELMMQSSQALETIMEGEGNKRHYVELSANEKAGLAKHTTEWNLFGGYVATYRICWDILVLWVDKASSNSYTVVLDIDAYVC